MCIREIVLTFAVAESRLLTEERWVGTLHFVLAEERAVAVIRFASKECVHLALMQS